MRRKADFYILLWVLVMFLGLNIDRGNLCSALADNLLGDTHLTIDDYNSAQNMYRIGFIISEIPSHMGRQALRARPLDSRSNLFPLDMD